MQSTLALPSQFVKRPLLWSRRYPHTAMHALSGIGTAVGQGGPDFWYSSMRDYPARLLRSADPSHNSDARHTGVIGATQIARKWGDTVA